MHHTISKDLGSAEGGSFIQTSLRWHPSPIWVPPVRSGSWAELGSTMAEDRPGANRVSECCEALMAGRRGFAWAPQPLLNYLWSDQALQGSRAHRQSCLVGLQRHHVCWTNKTFLAWRSVQGCACVPEAAISPRRWTLWLGSLCASVFSEWGPLDPTGSGCSFSGWTFGGYQPGLEAGRAISSEPAKGAPLGPLSLHPPPYLPFQKHNLSVYYQEIQTL